MPDSIVETRPGAGSESSQTEVRLLSTAGILGYGFPEACLQAGMARKPHLVSADGGSSDPGPYYLGSGEAFVSRMAMRREAGIPLAVGTAGGAPHLKLLADIVREIAHTDGLHFRMATIGAEQFRIGRRSPPARDDILRQMPARDADHREATTHG